MIILIIISLIQYGIYKIIIENRYKYIVDLNTDFGEIKEFNKFQLIYNILYQTGINKEVLKSYKLNKINKESIEKRYISTKILTECYIKPKEINSLQLFIDGFNKYEFQIPISTIISVLHDEELIKSAYNNYKNKNAEYNDYSILIAIELKHYFYKKQEQIPRIYTLGILLKELIIPITLFLFLLTINFFQKKK